VRCTDVEFSSKTTSGASLTTVLSDESTDECGARCTGVLAAFINDALTVDAGRSDVASVAAEVDVAPVDAE
jgi:hypothetical protein